MDLVLQLGVIEESERAWPSPIVMVIKPGKGRIFLDCRKVNTFTEKDFPKPFAIHCDASKSSVGALLVQVSQEGDECPIAFILKKLNRAQRNYTVPGGDSSLEEFQSLRGRT